VTFVRAASAASLDEQFTTPAHPWLLESWPEVVAAMRVGAAGAPSPAWGIGEVFMGGVPARPASSIGAGLRMARGGFFSDRGPTFALARIAVPKALYLAPRRDGRPGTGRQDDPLDASTPARFDRIISNAVAGAALLLLPGTYETHGAGQDSAVGPELRSGCSLIGLGGREVTRLRLNPASPYPAKGKTALIRAGRPRVDGANWVVRGITFDCNGAAVPDPAHAISAVAFWGDFPSLIECEAVNARGNVARQSECFVFYASPGVTNKARIGGARYERCVVRNTMTDPAQIYIAAFTISYNGTTNLAGPNVEVSEITDCEWDAGALGGGHGFSIFPRLRIANCRARGRTSGAYGDSWGLNDVVIENNVFAPVGNGVWITRATSQGMATNIVIRGNTIRLRESGTSTFGIGLDGGDARLLRDVVVEDNVIEFDGPAPRSWLVAMNLTGLRAENNRLHGPLQTGVSSATTRDVVLLDNRSLSGGPLSAGGIATNRAALREPGRTIGARAAIPEPAREPPPLPLPLVSGGLLAQNAVFVNTNGLSLVTVEVSVAGDGMGEYGLMQACISTNGGGTFVRVGEAYQWGARPLRRALGLVVPPAARFYITNLSSGAGWGAIEHVSVVPFPP
jgi:hypothetical protein